MALHFTFTPREMVVFPWKSIHVLVPDLYNGKVDFVTWFPHACLFIWRYPTESRSTVLLKLLSNSMFLLAREKGAHPDMPFDDMVRLLGNVFTDREVRCRMIHEERQKECLQELLHRKQRSDETCRDFAKSVQDRAAICFEGLEEAVFQSLMVTYFVIGMCDETIKQGVKDKNPSTLSQALSVAEKIVQENSPCSPIEVDHPATESEVP